MGMGCKHNQEMGRGEQEGECQRGPKEAQIGKRLGPWSYLPHFSPGPQSQALCWATGCITVGLVGAEPYLTLISSSLTGSLRKEELDGQADPCKIKGACSFSSLKHLRIKTS